MAGPRDSGAPRPPASAYRHFKEGGLAGWGASRVATALGRETQEGVLVERLSTEGGAVGRLATLTAPEAALMAVGLGATWAPWPRDTLCTSASLRLAWHWTSDAASDAATSRPAPAEGGPGG